MDKHYTVIYYYKRYERKFNTEQAARNAIQAKQLTSTACHYTELWEMESEDKGKQLELFECSNRKLIVKE